MRRPLVALGAASVLWGAAVSGTKYALAGFGPVTLLSVELVAAAAVLWVALLVRGYRPPRSWWLPALLGLLEPALAYLGLTLGLAQTSAVHGALITGLESALVVVLAAMVLREAIPRPAITAVLMAVAGLLVLAAGGGHGGAGHITASGDFLVAGGVLSASLYTIMAKRFGDDTDPLSLTTWQFTMAALVALAVCATRWASGAELVPGKAAPAAWLVAIGVGVAGYGLSFLLFNTVIASVDAGWAAVVLNLIPVFGFLSAVIFLREGVTASDAARAFLVGLSVLYFTVADRRGAAAAPAASP